MEEHYQTVSHRLIYSTEINFQSIDILQPAN